MQQSHNALNQALDIALQADTAYDDAWKLAGIKAPLIFHSERAYVGSLTKDAVVQALINHAFHINTELLGIHKETHTPHESHPPRFDIFVRVLTREPLSELRAAQVLAPAFVQGICEFLGLYDPVRVCPDFKICYTHDFLPAPYIATVVVCASFKDN